MDITSSVRESIPGELIQIKYEGKIIKLVDHIGEYLHVLRRGQDLLNKTQNHQSKMCYSVKNSIKIIYFTLF